MSQTGGEKRKIAVNDAYEVGYCSWCGAPTGLRMWRGTNDALCDGCYWIFDATSWNIFTDPKNAGRTVGEIVTWLREHIHDEAPKPEALYGD